MACAWDITGDLPDAHANRQRFKFQLQRPSTTQRTTASKFFILSWRVHRSEYGMYVGYILTCRSKSSRHVTRSQPASCSSRWWAIVVIISESQCVVAGLAGYPVLFSTLSTPSQSGHWPHRPRCLSHHTATYTSSVNLRVV